MHVDVERGLFEISDEMAAINLSKFIDKFGLEKIDNVGVIFHVVAFCMMIAYGRVHRKVSVHSGDQFLEKAANYIITDIMGVQLRSFIVTTSEYRRTAKILIPAMVASGKQFQEVFECDLDDVKAASSNVISFWLERYKQLEVALQLTPISVSERRFVEERFVHSVYEIRKRD